MNHIQTKKGIPRESENLAVGINRRVDGGRVLELLAVSAEDGGIHLYLAGGAEVRLDVEGINCRLKDVGEPWPVGDRPRHPVEEGG